MTFVCEKMAAGSWNLRREPLAVRMGRLPILQPLPDCHGCADVSDREAPGSHECELVVVPSPEPLANRLPEDVSEPSGRLAGDGGAVSVRYEIAESGGDLVCAD
jgi:hypothetical protein